MPTFPTILAQRSVATSLPTPSASPNAFGAGIGQAVQNIGGQISQAADRVAQQEQRRQDLETRLALSEAGRTWTQRMLDRKTGLQGNPAGFTDTVLTDFDDFQAEMIGNAATPQQADEFRLGLDQLKTTLVRDAASFEASQSATYMRGRVQDALDQTTNLVFSDPTQYQALVPSALSVIEASGMPGAIQDELRQSFVNGVATARFDGMIGSAATPEQLDAIKAELGAEEWVSAINPAQYKTLTTAIDTRRAALEQIGVDRANAVFDTMKDRMEAGAQIPPAELDFAQRTILESGDAKLIEDFGAARLHYDTVRQALVASPAQISAQVQAMEMPNPDATLIDAIIWQESRGNPNAISPAGAAGIMQVMPSTAVEIAREIGDANFPHGENTAVIQAYLSNPDVSKKYGVHYLNKMLARYDGDVEAALIGYNGGPLRADRWLAAGRDDSVIPAETREYYKLVLGRFAELGGQPGFSRAEYIQVGAMMDAQKKIEAGLTSDPLAWANQVGNVNLGDVFNDQGFDAAGLQQRAADAQTVASYYGTEPAIFTAPEVQALTEQLRTAAPEAKVEMAQTLVANLGGQAPVAFEQLQQSAPLFSAVGGMMLRDPEYLGVASDVFRGQQVVAESPDREKTLGSIDERTAVFNEIDGGAPRFQNQPELQQQMREMADALYVLDAPMGSAFDPGKYRAAAERVMGGVETTTMGGRTVILPAGVEPEQFHAALDRIEDTDLVRLSATGGAPVDKFGQPLPAEAIVGEGAFEIEAEDIFRVRMPDGYALDAATGDLYRIQLDAEAVKAIAGRGAAGSIPTTTSSDAASQAEWESQNSALARLLATEGQ